MPRIQQRRSPRNLSAFHCLLTGRGCGAETSGAAGAYRRVLRLHVFEPGLLPPSPSRSPPTFLLPFGRERLASSGSASPLDRMLARWREPLLHRTSGRGGTCRHPSARRLRLRVSRRNALLLLTTNRPASAAAAAAFTHRRKQRHSSKSQTFFGKCFGK